MAILIKLFATSMVANNFCGRSKRSATIFIALEPESISVLISVELNENNATSAPEISAEQTSNNNNKIKPNTRVKSASRMSDI